MHLLLSLFLISYAATFLTPYPGAQPTAAGGAFCGIADNAYTNFYNPAGLAFQKDFDIVYENTPLFLDIRYWDFAGALPLNKNLSLGFFSSGMYSRWINRDMWGDSTTITFCEFGPGVAFGYKLHDFLGSGISIKYIQSSLSMKSPSYNSWTIGRSFAADIGLFVKYPFSFGKAGFGFAVQHIGPAMAYTASSPLSGVKDPLPITIRAGFSYSISAQEVYKTNQKEWFWKWLKEKWRLVIAYDISKVKEEQKFWHSFGLEIRPIPILALRFGYFSAPEPDDYAGRKGWVKGLGIDLKFIRLDISDDSAFFWSNPNRTRFSFSLNIGEPIFPRNGILGK